MEVSVGCLSMILKQNIIARDGVQNRHQGLECSCAKVWDQNFFVESVWYRKNLRLKWKPLNSEINVQVPESLLK